MLGVGTLGILLNIFSICFFIRQHTHRTFHRNSWIIMLGVGTLGILLNIFSICFFIRQRTHRTFQVYARILMLGVGALGILQCTPNPSLFINSFKKQLRPKIFVFLRCSAIDWAGLIYPPTVFRLNMMEKYYLFKISAQFFAVLTNFCVHFSLAVLVLHFDLLLHQALVQTRWQFLKFGFERLVISHDTALSTCASWAHFLFKILQKFVINHQRWAVRK